MKDIVIFGAGGLGREAVSLINAGINLRHPGTYNLRGFIVEKKYFQKDVMINGYPVLGTPEWLYEHKEEVCCALAIGDYSHERERIFHMLDDQGVVLETLVSGDAYVPPQCKVGRGCYVGSGVFLPVNGEVGDGVFFNTQCIFGHDVKIGDFCTFYPRVTVSGRCVFGRHAKIGGCAYIVPGKTIGENSTIAAGSIVFSNVKAGTTVLGNPAKRMKELE